MSTPKRIFVVVGEASGDALGASLVDVLRARHGDGVHFQGIAGEQLKARGIESLFDLEDIAVMGIAPVVARLPTIVSRLKLTVDAVVASAPDLLIVIDSPDFCHRVARRVRAAAPAIPIIGWVSPSVWAWRPGRAKAMRAYIDHLLALLPFEVDAHKELGGPPTSYVGHPLFDQIAEFDAAPQQDTEPGEVDLPRTFDELLVLPGSRSGEISRHLPLMKDTLEKLATYRAARGDNPLKVVVPAVPAHAERITQIVSGWRFNVSVVSGDDAKKAAFSNADAAIAASGTVTLELALARIPMIVVYRLDPLARLMRWLVKVWTIVLPNLVWGRPVIREYVDEYARPEALARGLDALLSDTPERRAQLEAFDELHQKFAGSASWPSDSGSKAADIVEQFLGLRPEGESKAP